MTRILLVALVAALTLASSAHAAPWEPPKPKKGHSALKWLDTGCAYVKGVQRAYGGGHAYVYKLPKGWRGDHGMFYQKIKVQIDYHGGFSGDGPMWRKISAKTYEKKDASGDKVYFQRSSGLPDASPWGHSIGNFPGLTDLTVKVTVWLKRYGSPKAVWRYKKRSKPFQCNGAAVQGPIVNGGS